MKKPPGSRDFGIPGFPDEDPTHILAFIEMLFGLRQLRATFVVQSHNLHRISTGAPLPHLTDMPHDLLLPLFLRCAASVDGGLLQFLGFSGKPIEAVIAEHRLLKNETEKMQRL